jgi:hypothetical protein
MKAQTFRLSPEGLSRLEAWISPSCWFLAPSKNQQLAGGFRDNFKRRGAYQVGMLEPTATGSGKP